MTKLLGLVALLLLTKSSADIVVENELIKQKEIFDLEYAKSSNVWMNDANTTKYYCVFRGNWNPKNQPADFPDLARFGKPMIFSHTKDFIPFLKNRAAKYGVEVIAESTYTDKFKEEIQNSGGIVYDSQEGQGFFVNVDDVDKNYEYLPALKFNKDFPWISSLVGISPTPDWFTMFYLFETTQEGYDTYWESFKIRTYPWDAGTDDGDTYTALDRDTDPAGVITRFTTDNAPNKAFVSADGTKVPYVTEYECVLHVCPLEEPDCEKPDWPPASGCDILRYPLCETFCDPDKDSPCQECKRTSMSDPEKVYHSDCCQAGRDPVEGDACSEEDELKNSAGERVSVLVTGMAIMTVFLGLML